MEENVKPLSDIPAINRFLSYCRIRTVPSKTVVIHAGDLPDVLYYIISGSVEVMIEDEEGNEMVLAYLNRGQFFGEMGLFFSDQPTRSAWVRTRNQCELAEMTYPRFRQIAAESPGLIFELATQLATRLDRTNRKLGDLAFVDVRIRFGRYFGDLADEVRYEGLPWTFPLTPEQVGARALAALPRTSERVALHSNPYLEHVFVHPNTGA